MNPLEFMLHSLPFPPPSEAGAESWSDFAAVTDDGIALRRQDGTLPGLALPKKAPEGAWLWSGRPRIPELVHAVQTRGWIIGSSQLPSPAVDDFLAANVLVVPRSERWREAVSTALIGSWCDPLWQTGQLSSTALGALKAEARVVHRQLVPLWRRRTRHGRVLSLDASLGDGLSLYDLVATDVDLLARTADGVFEDERLNRVLHGLTENERQTVFAYAEGEGTTWTEAAVYASATDPEAFGERVRRKAKRLAAEQRRRAEQRRTGSPAPR
ncbi:hypothetical protein AB0L75_38310 [Streptomyces sp. NPDC052101]|uniref:hypothetical protein n=1 Tax=Streptomyces sp. NPDC052101 TaxID=3155763 RepID=UPI0034392E45